MPRAAVQDDVGSLRIEALPLGPVYDSVLMVDPSAYDVIYKINPHMDPDRARVDRRAAAASSQSLARAYEAIGYRVQWLPAATGWPDLVFCANQSLPFLDDAGRPAVLMSVMAHAERAGEVPLIERFFRQRGDRVLHLSDAGQGPCEGQGDLLWFPGRRLLLGGVGPRTSRQRLAEVAELLDTPVIALELCDPRFYHLDTCLAPLDAARALWVPDAFTKSSRDLLARLFARLLPVDPAEAESALSANAHCPDGRHVIIEAAATGTRALLAAEGFRPIPVDTSPFLLSGGSVFCLKQMLPVSTRVPRSIGA